MAQKKKNTVPENTNQLLSVIIDAIQDKKGKEIIDIDLGPTGSAICDHFVICHGDSTTQVDAIANHVEQMVKSELNEKVFHSEGFENSQWVLLDYSDIVVHVFQKPYRDFYKLEELWADGHLKYIKEE